jgi:hypothetical protein
VDEADGIDAIGITSRNGSSNTNRNVPSACSPNQLITKGNAVSPDVSPGQETGAQASVRLSGYFFAI